MNFWKNHLVLRAVLIVLFFVVGLVLTLVGWNMTGELVGLGIMLAANEVPRIAQQFGLDSSVRVNVSSVIHSTSSAVNLARTVFKPRAV